MSRSYKILILFWLFLPLTLFAESLDWKENPVVYGISPYYFAKDQPVKAFTAIRKRLPEIKELGANVIWLMPITVPSEPDHGYNVIDLENIWSELGSEKDFKALVSEAHKMNIKIILDVVMNHSSIHHPFVEAACKNPRSAVKNFYQNRPLTNVPYGRHFNSVQMSECASKPFIYYFWPELLNYNYENPGLRKYLIGTLKKWITEYDVDGFRFDASWGPSSRWSDFYKVVSRELKEEKADIVLLAEDKAAYPAEYEGSGHPHLKGSSFDWAYDWNNRDEDWISKWSFGIEEDKTVFNVKEPARAAALFLKALSYTKNVQNIKVFRYLENNDTPGFRRHHSLAQTKFAAKVMFLLPGVPLIFYGQEIGSAHEQWHLETLNPERTIKSYNPSLHSFYKNLISMRRGSAVLSKGRLENVKHLSPIKVSFERRLQDKVIRVELDFKDLTVNWENLSIYSTVRAVSSYQ